MMNRRFCPPSPTRFFRPTNRHRPSLATLPPFLTHSLPFRVPPLSILGQIHGSRLMSTSSKATTIARSGYLIEWLF